MLLDYFKQGVQNLRHRSLRSILTMIGIFIGVALVVALMSLGQGMQEAIVGQFSDLGAETLTIQPAGGGFGPPGSYQSVTIDDDDLRTIKRTPGIEEAFGRSIGSAKIELDDEQQFGYYATIADDPGEYELSLTIPTKLEVDQGRMIGPGDNKEVVIGSTLADRPMLGRELRVRDKISIDGEAFDVVGILEQTGNPQLDMVLWMTTEAAQDLSGQENYGLIAARLEDGADPEEVKQRVERELRRSRDVELGKEDFVVQSSQDVIDSLNSILGAVTWFLIGIASISILVGAVGITNTMYTSVLERTKEIGIMKAIGAKNSDVLTIFLMESGLLGVVGGVIGILLGLGLAFSVQAIAEQALGTQLIRANVSILMIALSVLGSFLVGSVAGITPARQAARMKPVEALRYG